MGNRDKAPGKKI